MRNPSQVRKDTEGWQTTMGKLQLYFSRPILKRLIIRHLLTEMSKKCYPMFCEYDYYELICGFF